MDADVSERKGLGGVTVVAGGTCLGCLPAGERFRARLAGHRVPRLAGAGRFSFACPKENRRKEKDTPASRPPGILPSGCAVRLRVSPTGPPCPDGEMAHFLCATLAGWSYACPPRCRGPGAAFLAARHPVTGAGRLSPRSGNGCRTGSLACAGSTPSGAEQTGSLPLEPPCRGVLRPRRYRPPRRHGQSIGAGPPQDSIHQRHPKDFPRQAKKKGAAPARRGDGHASQTGAEPLQSGQGKSGDTPGDAGRNNPWMGTAPLKGAKSLCPPSGEMTPCA